MFSFASLEASRRIGFCENIPAPNDNGSVGRWMVKPFGAVSLIWCPEDATWKKQSMEIFSSKPNWDFMLKLMKWKQNFQTVRQNQCRPKLAEWKIRAALLPSRHTVKLVLRLFTFKHMPWNMHKSSIMNNLQNLIWHESANDFESLIKHFEDMRTILLRPETLRIQRQTDN